MNGYEHGLNSPYPMHIICWCLKFTIQLFWYDLFLQRNDAFYFDDFSLL